MSPSSVMPRSWMSGIAASSSSRAVARRRSVSAVASMTVCDRVARVKSPNRSRSTTVRQTRCAPRIRWVSLSISPTITVSSAPRERGIDRPSARCAPIERRRRRTRSTCRGSRLFASACRCRPDARPTISIRRSSSNAASCPTRGQADRVELRLRDRSDAPQPLDRQRVQELDLAIRRHDQQPVRLGRRARDLGQVLRARDAHGDRQPDLAAHPFAQPRRDRRRRSRDAFEAADVEERLVDRDALHVGSGVPEDVEDRLARLDVRVEVRRHHDEVRTQAPRRRATHRRADAAGLGLVARGHHHAAADGDGLAAQRRIVPLMNGGKECVQVSVQYVRLHEHEHMFARG